MSYNSVESTISFIRKHVKADVDYYNNHIKFSLNGKIFAIIYKGNNPHIVLKAEGRFNKQFRKEFKETVFPSYTINSFHWNMIFFERELPLNIIHKLILNSYEEVVENMTKRQKNTYEYIMSLN